MQILTDQEMLLVSGGADSDQHVVVIGHSSTNAIIVTGQYMAHELRANSGDIEYYTGTALTNMADESGNAALQKALNSKEKLVIAITKGIGLDAGMRAFGNFLINQSGHNNGNRKMVP